MIMQKEFSKGEKMAVFEDSDMDARGKRVSLHRQTAEL